MMNGFYINCHYHSLYLKKYSFRNQVHGEAEALSI